MQASASRPLPVESLNLSASIFTSQIDSWIPKDFGRSTSVAQAEQNWQSVLRSTGEGKERLGVGHPQIDAPKVKSGYTAGLEGLKRTLKQEKQAERQVKQSEIAVHGDGKGEEVSEDDEDSRFSAVGKRKRTVASSEGPGKLGKKGKMGSQVGVQRTLQPMSSSGMKSSATAQVALAPDDDRPPVTDSASPITGQTIPGATTKDALNSVPSQSPSPVNETLGIPSNPAISSDTPSDSPKKSKSARKKERRRLAKQAAAAQGSTA